jgi:hypothetical protein
MVLDFRVIIYVEKWGRRPLSILAFLFVVILIEKLTVPFSENVWESN